jgi:hypothetical protein
LAADDPEARAHLRDRGSLFYAGVGAGIGDLVA